MGFIGTNLVNYLYNKYHVTTIDIEGRLRDVFPLFEVDGICGDICNPTLLLDCSRYITEFNSTFTPFETAIQNTIDYYKKVMKI